MGFSEHIPFMSGETHVLHHMNAMQTIPTFKIEGPEINAIIITIVKSTKSHANKTLSRNIFPPQININPAVCKHHILQPGIALQADCGPISIVRDLNLITSGDFMYVHDPAVVRHLNKVVMGSLGISQQKTTGLKIYRKIVWTFSCGSVCNLPANCMPFYKLMKAIQLESDDLVDCPFLLSDRPGLTPTALHGDLW